MTDEQRKDLEQAIKLGSWPDGSPVTVNQMAELDGCCPHCWLNFNTGAETGMPFKGIARKTGERKLKAGEVRINKALWGVMEIRQPVMHVPYSEDGKEWGMLEIDIEYCPFCGRKLGETQE